MATEPRRRTARAPQTPQNSTKLGVILVVAAVLVGVLIFSVGGGTDDGDDGRTAAEQAQGDDGTTETTEPEVLTPTTQPVATLRLVIANGSGVSGRAGLTKERFDPLGYANSAAVDGSATETTFVYFAPGFDADANSIATIMGLTADRVAAMPQPQPLKTPDPAAQVIVLLGKDFDPATAAWSAAPGATN